MKTMLRIAILAFVTLFLFTSCLSPSGSAGSGDTTSSKETKEPKETIATKETTFPNSETAADSDIVVDFVYVHQVLPDGFIGSSDIFPGETYVKAGGGGYYLGSTVRIEYHMSAYRKESGEIENGTIMHYDGIITSVITDRLSNENEPHYSGGLSETTSPEETTAP